MPKRTVREARAGAMAFLMGASWRGGNNGSIRARDQAKVEHPRWLRGVQRKAGYASILPSLMLPPAYPPPLFWSGLLGTRGTPPR